MNSVKIFLVSIFFFQVLISSSQKHPEIYISNDARESFLDRMQNSSRAGEFVSNIKNHIQEVVDRHTQDPEWIVSRLQMYWKTRYARVYVNGMDFSHGEGEAPVPTVRFSGSRDWDTDYLQPSLEDVIPYMDDERGLYLQNGVKEDQPWEWVKAAETGHIIERINEEILNLAEEAAFIYWLTNEEKYAVFASDIFMKYIEGMYYRDPPLTVENHGNAHLMGLQTFEVIHERIVAPVTVCYDFLHGFLVRNNKDLPMIQEVFRKWADQEIKYGVPGNNWNMMQARYITYLAIALEDDTHYKDGKGQQYYIDQVLNQNSEKQKALKDVLKNFDPETAIWPEVAHYSIMVSDDLLEIYCLLDKTLNNNLLSQSPVLEKAILANFHYLFPNDFTTAYGDAKHARLRFNSLELLIAQYRKYDQEDKELAMTKQLKRFMKTGAYNRERITSLFDLFFYVEDLMDVSPAESLSEMVQPTFYSPNVSWVVQRNGNSLENGMMISKNASLGNHSHANGVSVELYAKGMVVAPDGAAGASYWSNDHQEYYSRFPAHNTVVVNGVSDYHVMEGTEAFTLSALYPDQSDPLLGDYTFSQVNFVEPSTNARQDRLTGTVRTGKTSGYFVDIFRSSVPGGNDKKHEYIFHGQGKPVVLFDENGQVINTFETDELSTEKGDLVGYDYFLNKKQTDHSNDFYAQFSMPAITGKELKVNLWMKGYQNRNLFTVMAPFSRAINQESVPEALYHQPIPTLVVRQNGEAHTRPFVAIVDAFNEDENSVDNVRYFSPTKKVRGFIGIAVQEASRLDYIYNNAISKAVVFNDGVFSGTYAILTSQDKKMKSIMLGSGTLIEKEGWRVESTDAEGTVWLEINESELVVDAQKSFSLRMPVPRSARKEVAFTVNSSHKIYLGSVYKNGREKHVIVNLPPMKNDTLSFDFNKK